MFFLRSLVGENLFPTAGGRDSDSDIRTLRKGCHWDLPVTNFHWPERNLARVGKLHTVGAQSVKVSHPGTHLPRARRQGTEGREKDIENQENARQRKGWETAELKVNGGGYMPRARKTVCAAHRSLYRAIYGLQWIWR